MFECGGTSEGSSRPQVRGSEPEPLSTCLEHHWQGHPDHCHGLEPPAGHSERGRVQEGLEHHLRRAKSGRRQLRRAGAMS